MKSHVHYIELKEPQKEQKIADTPAVEKEGILLRLPTDMWLKVYHYLDVQSAVSFHITYQKLEILTKYVANDNYILRSMLDTYFVENTLPTFVANINSATTEELNRRNAIILNRSPKKSTWARVLTGAGTALTSLLPAWGIKKTLYAFSQSNLLSDLRSAVFDQLKSCLNPTFIPDNFYSENECDPTPDGKYVSDNCHCTYHSLVDDCRYGVSPCAENGGGFSTLLEQCNATLWSTFTSACDDLEGSFGYSFTKYAWAIGTCVVAGSIVGFTICACLAASEADTVRKDEILKDKFSALPLRAETRLDTCNRYFLDKYFLNDGHPDPTTGNVLRKFRQLKDGRRSNGLFASKKLHETSCALFFRKQPDPSLSSNSSDHIIQIKHKGIRK